MLLTLRARILLVLVLIGLVPLLFAVVINLPLVLDQVGLFYRHAFLQDLRDDFRDLDEHLASRHETVRLLAKLPEPGALMGTEGGVEQETIDVERARYTEWINRILADQLDVIHINFLDEQGVARFWLERDPELRTWSPTAARPPYPRADLLQTVLANSLLGVLPTPVRVDAQAATPEWVLTLQLLSPIISSDGSEVIGMVAVTLDIGGLARRDPDTLWVRDNGGYLNAPGMPQRTGNAFDDFDGLDQRFNDGQLTLWEGADGKVVAWVPLLRTSDNQPLWVARTVDRTPLENFKNALIIRVLGVVLLLVISTLLVARWFADRSERMGQELLEGIRRMLQQDEAVTFSWRGGREMRQLGDDLSELAQTHARNVRNLRAHARELEQSNRYKSEFLANVSHELRTPLNSILLLSKMLTEHDAATAQEQRERASVIHEASKDLRSLIDNILDLSRIEAGQLEMHTERVDLRQLIQDVVALLRPQFVSSGLTLAVEIDAEAPAFAITDPDKVRQILKNFLANAVKFTEQGGAVIGLRAASPPYAMLIAVKDTGVGIIAEDQHSVFEAFKQVDGSTRRRYGGTGLGLTISRDLAALLGGEIRLHSDPGDGSEFSLLLPEDCDCGSDLQSATKTIERAPESPVAEPEVSALLPPEFAFDGQQVLVIEPDVRRLLDLTPVLEQWGLSVLAAADRDEAEDALQEESVDLVLVSTDSSGSGGYATIESMRHHERLNDASLIALIGENSADACEAALQAGADDAVFYPLDWALLCDTLQRRLIPGGGE